ATPEIFMPSVDLTSCLPGRVVRVHGLQNVVMTEDGQEYVCTVRRLLRSLTIDERSVVTTGDRVWFRPVASEGTIEKVEPRYGLLTRKSWKREHVLVANVDQIVIVAALAEPFLKPHLIDRYLVAASMGKLKPIICFNKTDLVDPAVFQPILGMYAQLGYDALLTSTHTGRGIEELRHMLLNRQTVFSGQSGVGKTSLLNRIEPGLELRVREVSDMTQKGRHTTTTAELIRLSFGGWVVDTPGIRQFDLWDVISAELDGHFPEFRPFVAHCGFPGCSHLREENCAVRQALDEGWIDPQRYYSYRGIHETKDAPEIEE
ncbi:MAG TPA: ribosome small subunit-dependent GTPase A, partial [Gemmatales bacterium]|nr:ribosome small subunit-dependent GTPase A [Gemmatales bacterium]